jgi:hypothetical protein
MEHVWYEDQLEVRVSDTAEVRKQLVSLGLSTNSGVQEPTLGLVRVDYPRWATLGELPTVSIGKPCKYVLVRLGFQFDLVESAKDSGKIVEAKCSAKILSSNGSGELPRVYDLVPKDYYEETDDPAELKIDPSLGVGFLKLSGLSLTTKLDIGSQEPVVVGYPGEEERAPYWDLRPRKRQLNGWHRFWLLIECPASCTSFDIAVRAGALAATKFGPMTVGPRNWQWTDRPRTSISVGDPSVSGSSSEFTS